MKSIHNISISLLVIFVISACTVHRTLPQAITTMNDQEVNKYLCYAKTGNPIHATYRCRPHVLTCPKKCCSNSL